MTLDLSLAGWTVGPWLAAAILALAWVRWQVGPPLHRAHHRILGVFRGCILVALVVIGANPVHVSVTPGAVRRPEVHILLDASQSMLLGSPESRWGEGTAFLRAALSQPHGYADVRIHRFGQRLVPIDVNAFVAGADLAPPDDADTQLAAAFRQLVGRLGREAPAAVIVVSDGRVRDPDTIDDMAALWRRLQVPVHVVPLGHDASGGDAAIIAAIAPARVRKQSQVDVSVFLRSFGFAGQRTEVQLQALDESGMFRRTIRTVPITLQDGVQTLTLTFRSEPDLKKLRLHIPPTAGDLSLANNDFPLEMEIDRTKIRVLLIDGSVDPLAFRAVPGQSGVPGDDSESPEAPFRDALLADPDIQCSVYGLTPGGGEPRRVRTRDMGFQNPAFPQTPAELLAYDAIVLSNVPRSALSDEVLGWIEEWIGKRGGGLVMAGGPSSFGAGGWAGTQLERMLPVELLGGPDWEVSPTTPEPANSELHPIWRLFEDERATRKAIRSIPEAAGRNNWVRVKPQSGTLLGVQKPGAGTGITPLLAVGAYGRGRTVALASPLSATWAPQFTRQWGEGDNRHFAKFARNLVYWVTETSAIGRRRLVATTDKRFYHPGETVSISAHAYDEAATRTGGYRIIAALEPRQLEGLPPCPVKWPAGRVRAPGEMGALLHWGEEIELHLDPQTKDYSLPLPLVETLAAGEAGQAFKVELTAYEGQTQIDSHSIDVQILSDPHEQQNPLPNHEFLAALARGTGGREFADPKALADALAELSITENPSTVRRTPLWSRELILAGLLTLLSAEWFYRRWLGLA